MSVGEKLPAFEIIPEDVTVVIVGGPRGLTETVGATGEFDERIACLLDYNMAHAIGEFIVANQANTTNKAIKAFGHLLVNETPE